MNQELGEEKVYHFDSRFIKMIDLPSTGFYGDTMFE